MRRVTGPAAFLTISLLGCKSEQPSSMAEALEACHDSEMSCARPILNVRSLRASQNYYRDALGFKLDWDHGDPPDFGSVSRGHSILFMCEGCQGNPWTWVMVFTEDVNRLHEEFVRQNARIRMPPKDMPWGLREMHVSDPDGNVLRFGSSTEH